MRLLHARVPLRAWRPVSLLALLSLLLPARPAGGAAGLRGPHAASLRLACEAWEASLAPGGAPAAARATRPGGTPYSPSASAARSPPRPRAAYVLVHYGERLFYAGGYCPSCVAVAALQCTQPAYPIVLLAAEGTDRGELNHLQAATGVQVRYVQPIAAPKHCASQLIGSRQPLLGVLTKLNYWALTEFERVLNVDSDALAVRSLDGLVEMDMGKGDFAASGVGCQKDPVGKHAREGGTGTVRKWALHFKHQAGVVLATPKAEYIKRLLEMRSSTRERCKYSIEQPLVNSFFASKLGVKEVGDKISRRRDNPRFSQSFNCRLDNFGGCCDREGLPLHVVHTAGGDVKPWRDNGATRRAYKSKTRGAFMAAWCRMQLAWGVRNATGAPLAQSLTSGCFGELEYGGSGSARTHFEVEADEAVTTLGGDADRREEVGADDE